MESRSQVMGARKRSGQSRVDGADALLDLGTKATRLILMLAVLGMTVWEAFGH
jgi:hypothetical protein